MKTGEIYLIKYNNDYYMIKVLDIVFHFDDLVAFELIHCRPSPTYFGKGRRYLGDLKELIIKPLKRKNWYKLIRKININEKG